MIDIILRMVCTNSFYLLLTSFLFFHGRTFHSSVTGVLRLELAKENYERSGLVGKSIRDRGRKHVKARFGMSNDMRD